MTYSLLDQIGNTPLLRLQRITRDLSPAVEVHVKAEWFNPGGSVKDRSVRRIIEDAERDGALTRDRIILDSSSGNAAIAYAMIGAAKGYRVRLVVPENVSEERKRILRAFGVEVQYSSPLEGSDGAILVARELAHADRRYFLADQYNNPSNVRAHYETTGPEIFEQTQGRVTHFVAGLGTSGTIVGAGRRLRELRPDVEIVAVEPDSGVHGIEGLKHMATAIVPGIYDPSVHDHKISVRTEAAYAMARSLAAEEGLLVGQSTGAAVVAALAVASTLSEGVVVALGPDGGDRYLSTSMWEGGAQAGAGDDGFVSVLTTAGGRLSFRRRFCYIRRGEAVVLARDHLAAVLAQAREEAPNECCGLLLGREGRVERVFRGTNIDHSPVTYNMDPQELFRAHREMEAGGRDLVAIYHSHPRTRAYPSSTDIAKATYPDSFYMIVSPMDPEAPEVRVYRITNGRVSEGTVIVS